MASGSTVDLDRLLAPIGGDDPCGADLRWEPEYQEIKDARPKADRDPFGEDGIEEVAGDWRPLCELSSETLASRSKDLMLAAYLVESLIHLHGFAGFRDGMKVINGLLSNFWDGLYPRPDDGDLGLRAAPLVYLTTEGRGAMLPNLLRESPLTPDRDRVFSVNYWKARQPRQMREKEDADAYRQWVTDAEEKTRQFNEAVSRMSRDAALKVYQDLEESQAEFKRFGQIVMEKFGSDGPGITDVRSALEDCLQRMKIIGKEKGIFEVAGDTGEPEAVSENGEAAPSSSGGGYGPIRTREDAFRRLADVANFLRQKEPQNPIYLLVDRAHRWSQLPFEELLHELIKDAGARDQVSELLGIKPPESSSS